LDLTDYTGNDLHIFNETTTNMGYVSPITPNNAYAVTMSSNQYHIFLDGVDNPTINFQANQTYLFTQDDSSNVEYQIVFGATHGKVPLYETNYIIMGSLGRPGSYTQLSLPSDFTGNMDYFLKSLIRNTNYFVKVVTNHLNKPVLVIADTLSGTYYRQPDISFSSPNIYFFDVADVTNDAHVLEFGTSYDSSSNSATIVHSRNPGVSGAFTFLDLSTYYGSTLYYSSDVSSGMGFVPHVLDTNTIVTYPNANENFNSISDNKNIFSYLENTNAGNVLSEDIEGWNQVGTDISLSFTSPTYSSFSNADIVAVNSFVYEKSGNNWIQKGSDFGGQKYTSLSKNGLTIAVFESSTIVKVYDWSINDWVQRGSDIVNPSSDPWSGENWMLYFKISGNGNVVVIGDYTYPSGGGSYHSRIYVYEWNGSSWVTVTPFPWTDTTSGGSNRLGQEVDLSDDGNTIIASGLHV